MNSDRSLPDLLRDLLNQLTALIRDEGHLVRAEMTEKINQVSSGAGMLAAALAFGIGTIVILLMAGVYGLSEVVEPWLAALIVAGVALVLTLILAAMGKSRMKPRNLAPNRTVEQVRSDMNFAKEKAR